MSDPTEQDPAEPVTTPDAPIDPPLETPGPTNTDPPIQPPAPIVFQAALWYSATATCHTATCINYNQIMSVPVMYSNAGTNATIICGRCGKKATILTATLLDPQPPEE